MIRIAGRDVGRRVVLRHRGVDGRVTDVVGVLVALDATAALVQPDDRPPVRVALADLQAAKPVPERVTTPASSPEALERVLTLGWPGLETSRLGGWLLRAADGFTRRANSALAAGDPGLPVGDALEAVRGFYADRGLPPSVQVAVPLPGDRRWPDPGTLAAVRERGWVPDEGTVVMTRDLRVPAAAPAGVPEGARLRVDRAPDDAWLALYRYRGQGLPPVAVQVLTAAPWQAFASLEVGDRTVAVGRVAVAAGWAGVTAMEVAPDHRRRGLGTAVLRALLDRGRAEGARFAYLQVAADNAAGRALYRSVGFTGHHAYHYLAAPG